MIYSKKYAAGEQKIEKAKELIKKLLDGDQYSAQDIVSEIFNIYQCYLISQEEEIELYEAADPEGRYNDVSEYWYSGDYSCYELYKIFEGGRII